MYQKIMVAMDDSDTSRCALAEAVNLAKASKAKLYIAHVADETLLGMHGRTFSTTLNLDDAIKAIADAGQKLLDDSAASAAGIDSQTVLLEARNRRVSEMLVDKAAELGVDLLVVGRHGQRGISKLILGSVAEQVAKMAETSVLLVRKH